MKLSRRKARSLVSSATPVLGDYGSLLQDIKARIRHAQLRASFSVNRELILLYWDIGQLLIQRQVVEGWGAAVIPRLPGTSTMSFRN